MKPKIEIEVSDFTEIRGTYQCGFDSEQWYTTDSPYSSNATHYVVFERWGNEFSYKNISKKFDNLNEAVEYKDQLEKVFRMTYYKGAREMLASMGMNFELKENYE
jgi:hypothetical protein